MLASAATEINVARYHGDGVRWDQLVSRLPGSTFCHFSGWREVFEDVLGHRCEYLIASDRGGASLGALPLVRMRSRLFGHHLISVPFLNYGGPLADDPAVRDQLGAEAVARARRTGADRVQLRSWTDPPAGLQPSVPKVTVRLPLPDTADELWSQGFRSKLRSQIRRPQKAGMKTLFGPEQLPAFYEVFARNMRDLGTPVLSRHFFERIAQVFPDRVVFAAVYQKDQPVAAACGFEWRGEFEITWASSLREFNRDAPNMLLYWSLMEAMIERGVRVFNFGRCSPDASTYAFKVQWGGAPELLSWTEWGSRTKPGQVNGKSPVLQYALRAWQRIPLSAANRLGPLVSRRLPWF